MTKEEDGPAVVRRNGDKWWYQYARSIAKMVPRLNERMDRNSGTAMGCVAAKTVRPMRGRMAEKDLHKEKVLCPRPFKLP